MKHGAKGTLTEPKVHKIAFITHGTAVPTPYGGSIPKLAANFMQPDLFSKDAALKLLPIEKTDKTDAARNFIPLFEDTEINNIYKLEWSGLYGPNVWQSAADFLSDQILKMVKPDEIVEIDCLGHSHGGDVFRLLAENLQDHKNIRFKHIYTNCTPLCISPPLIMPSNVENWIHVTHPKDNMAYLGSWLMQGICSRTPVKRKVEDLIAEYEKVHGQNISYKGICKSIELPTELNLADPHNDAMRKSAADFIIAKVKEIHAAQEKDQRSTKRPKR